MIRLRDKKGKDIEELHVHERCTVKASPAEGKGMDAGWAEGQRAGGLSLPWPFGCAGRCKPCACCHMR